MVPKLTVEHPAPAGADTQTMDAGSGDAGYASETLEATEDKKREKIVRVDQIWDKKAKKFRFQYTKNEKPRSERFRRYVVTVARRISDRGTFEGHYVVEIRGSRIREALLEIYRDVREASFPKNISLDNKELPLLFHAYEALSQKLYQEKARELVDADTVFELEATVQFIEEHFGSTFLALKEFPNCHINFEYLWTLFPPHGIVYGSDALGQARAYRVQSSSYVRQEDGSTAFVISCDYLDSNGRFVGYVKGQKIKVPQFDGLRSILDLPVFPMQLLGDEPEIRKQLIERGRKILQLKGCHLQEYKGHALTEDGKKKFNSHGRVMLDPVMFDQVCPNNEIVPHIRTPIPESALSEDQILLFNPLLYGFSLGDKIWGAFAVTRLLEVSWNRNMIDSLVLDDERKDFIKNLIQYHSKEKDTRRFDDFVRDKGKGLVGLLAGPPGVGKTFTAEAVAEIAMRPLYVMSSGELGEDSSDVQYKLMAALELAEAWNAVVLLDEADVFLSKRSNDNLSKNAITSIFLRHLEYYQGILLLTTNRLLSIDEAFQSRVHFCFEYQNLDLDGRSKIWSRFLNRVRIDTDVDVSLLDEDIEALSKQDFNGRQIKNIVSVSQAVASERREPMTMDILQLAIDFAKVSWGPERRVNEDTTGSVMG